MVPTTLRLKDLIGPKAATDLLMAFMPEECPFGGNHGGACDDDCRDPFGINVQQMSHEEFADFHHAGILARLEGHDSNCMGCSYCGTDLGAILV